MDTKRLLSQTKGGMITPKSASSSNKHLRPRNFQKHDANCSYLCLSGHNASVMVSSKSLNQTVRQNMDITFGNSTSTKSTTNQVTIDLELGLAYNKYLQVLTKQQLVKEYIEQHERILNNQILLQCERVRNLQDTVMDIYLNIEALQEQTIIVENLEKINCCVSNLECAYSRHDSFARINELTSILKRESNLVSIKHIKPIDSQEEYDIVMSTLGNLKRVLKGIIDLYGNFNEIHEFAILIRSFIEMYQRVMLAAEELCESKKKAITTFLTSASDMFAQMGGYF